MFSDLTARKEVLEAELAAQAGIDPLRDRFVVGYITAVNDLLQVTIEEIQND